MNRFLLETLMNLFAHVARAEGVDERERLVVREFLLQELSEEVTEEYLKRFDHFAAQNTKPGDLERVVKQANRNLSAAQKYFILTRVVQLSHVDGEVSRAEQEAIDTIARSLGIPERDYADIYAFITSPMPRNLDRGRLLMIARDTISLHAAHLRDPMVEGYVALLHVETTDLMLMRYMGAGQLSLNGHPVNPGAVYLLHQGSVIRPQGGQPIFYSELMAPLEKRADRHRLHFEAQDVEFRFANGELALRGVNLSEDEGKLVALMGASGAGKTTLMNVLNGNNRPSFGHVLLNDLDIHRQPDRVRGTLGYVPQDDLLIEELSVFDNLFYSARLSFRNKTKQELTELVERSLRNLGLADIRNLRVGSPLNKKISGGQRKRLNIALELIREPAVLFVDEPTSGLSSRDAENVMQLLKELSRMGKLVFVVIHQPSSEIFKLFDKLFILDKGGYPIFYGPPLEALPYFKGQLQHVAADQAECPTCGNVTVEEIFSIIEDKVTDEFGQETQERRIPPERWHELYKKLRPPQQSAEPVFEDPGDVFKPVRPLRQFGVFFLRDLRAKLANVQYMSIALLEAPLLALLLAYILRYVKPNEGGYSLYHNENLPIWLLVAVITALFIGLTISAEEILRDRRVRQREKFLHLNQHSYLLAKLAILFVFSAVQMLVFVGLGNAVLGIEGLLWPYWVVLFSTACVANLMGLNISASFDSAVTIYVLVPIFLIPQIVLSGAIVRFDRLNPSLADLDQVPLFGEVMASRWAFEALAVTQFKDNAYHKPSFELDARQSQARWTLNYWVPEMEKAIDALGESPSRADLEFVHGELRRATRQFQGESFAVLARLQAGSWAPTVQHDTRQLLTRLKNHARNQVNRSRQQLDSLSRQREKITNLDALRMRHHNQALEDMVLNKASSQRIVREGGKFVQVSDPAYQTQRPNTGLFGLRNQLYVPYKYLGPNRLHTLWVNVTVLWLMSLVLYFTLYTEFFRKLMAMISQTTGRLLKRAGLRLPDR